MKPYLLHGHTRPLTKITFNWDGDLLFSAGKDGVVCVWNVEDGILLGRYGMDGKPVGSILPAVWSLDVTFDSKKLIVSSSETVTVYDVESSATLWSNNFGAVCRAVEWNKKPDCQDKFVVARDAFGQKRAAGIDVFQFNPEDETYTKTVAFEGYNSRCIGVSWGPFDETIISRHENGMIMVWDAVTGATLMEKQAHKSTVTGMDFTQDRMICITSCSDGTAKLWNTATFEEIQTYVTDRPLNDCAISPLFEEKDESARRMHVFVAGGQEAEDVTTTKTSEGKLETILFHMVYAEMLGTIAGHFSPVNSVACMPNGKGFATGAEEGYIRLYKFDQSYFDNPRFK